MSDDANPGLGSGSGLRLRPESPRQRSLAEIVFLGPNGIRVGWRVCVYLALFLLIEAALEFLISFDKFSAIAALVITPETLLAREMIFVAGVLGAAGIMARLEGRRVGDYGTPWRGAFSWRFWRGALWGIVQLSAIMLLIDAWHGYSFGGLAIHGGAIGSYALRWGVVFLAVGFAEESLFRGYLQFTLTEGIGFWPAALLLSFAFGAVHLHNPGEGVVGALSVFTIGMFLCLVLRRTGDLWMAIGWHAAFDFGETYFYSVPNSGLVMPGHLFAASLHGARWLTGGTVGPEGSAFSFAVLGVTAVAFVFVYRERPRAERSAHSDVARRAGS
jgi:membrane protease YdiL (CAAX protease family)